MQFNQPCYNTCMNDQYNTYPTPYPCPNIVGEGDVTSLVSPDGNVQFYFVPLSRRDRRFYPYSPPLPGNSPPPFPGNSPPWPVVPEAWLIRRISNPVIPSFIQDPFANRDPFLKSYFTSKINTEILPPSGYYQKFHYDNVTSTSDIHYFYPKLRQGNVKYSSGVQVDIPPKCHKSTQYETKSACPGPVSNIQLVRNVVRPYTNATDSAMSIDEKVSPSKRRKNISVSFKHHNKHKKHSERQACRCNSNNKSDKSITTYSDKGCCCLDADGRQTQTTVETVSRSSSKSHLSDVNTATSCESCCQTCDHCDDSSSDSDSDMVK